MADICVRCGLVVRPRQQAVSCDVCAKWQHRTCETGWHNRLNRAAGSGSSFYVLLTLLHRESEQVNNYVRLVNEDKLSRRQRKTTKAAAAKIFTLWDRYQDGEMSATSLLKQISTIYEVRISREDDSSDSD